MCRNSFQCYQFIVVRENVKFRLMSRKRSRSADDSCDDHEERLACPNRLARHHQASASPSAANDFSDKALDVFLSHFLRAVAVSPADVERRCQVIHEVQDAVAAKNLRAEIYGSVRTGIVLPSSDIDFFLSDASGVAQSASSSARTNFHGTRRERQAEASHQLRFIVNLLHDDRRFTRVVKIAHANVPIVKCVHKRTGCEIDISFTPDGLATSDCLVRHMQDSRCRMARGVIIMVKALLAEWSLNDPSCGGLGSFQVSLMVLWFLKTEACHYGPMFLNSIGVHLLGFLKYFGEDFDFKNQGIDLNRLTLFSKPCSSELTIMNPIDPSRNAAKACTRFGSEVRRRFAEANRVLLPIAVEPASLLSLTSLRTMVRHFSSTIKRFESCDEVLKTCLRVAQSNGQSAPATVDLLAVHAKKRSYLRPQNTWNELSVYTGGNS